MDRGLDIVVVEAESDFAYHSCPLVLSLATCLQEASAASGAIPHIEQALLDLGARLPLAGISSTARPSSCAALAAYLEFLIPELRMRSPRAAVSVRWAVDALRGVKTARTGIRAQ